MRSSLIPACFVFAGLLLVKSFAFDLTSHPSFVSQEPPTRVNPALNNLNTALSSNANVGMQQVSSGSAANGESTAMYDVNTVMNAATAFMLFTSNIVSMWIAYKMHKAPRRRLEVTDEDRAHGRSTSYNGTWDGKMLESGVAPIPPAAARAGIKAHNIRVPGRQTFAELG